VTRRGARLLAVLVALAGVLLGLASPASAESRGRILQVTSANGTVSVLLSGVDLPPGKSLDPTTATLTLDGKQLKTTASVVKGSSPTVSRTAVVCIDISGSMKGARLAAAKSAAASFVSSLPADVRVGLVTFSSTARVAVRPTLDHGVVSHAVGRLAATGNTALYDAAVLAVRTAGPSGARTVLLLSDGVDDGSRTALGTAVASVKNSGALVSAVAFGAEAAGAAPLRQVAETSGGSVITALDARQLAAAFREAALSINQQILITGTLPSDLTATSGTVVASAAVGAETVTDLAFTTLSKAAAKPTDVGPRIVDSGSSWYGSSATLYVAIGALFLGVVVLLLVAASSASQGDTPGVRRRLSIYTLTGRAPVEVKESTVLGDSAMARNAVEFAGRVVAQRDIESGLERKLDAAGVPLKPAEWLLLHIGFAILLAFAALLLSGADVVATGIGLLIGLAGPQIYLVVKEGRRLRAFLAQLPDTLQLLAGSLSAGYSFPQAVDAVVQEGNQPIAGEFNRALVESRLGVPIEEALDGISARMKSEDFSWVVMAIRIQREVGGNLNEVLMTVAGTLRERERLRRQVSVLSAEGRLSAYILGGLPPVFAAYLLLVRRAYIRPLFHDPIGIFMLILLVVLISVGAVWLRKVVTVEV
jgi:tight adherence protein B